MQRLSVGRSWSVQGTGSRTMLQSSGCGSEHWAQSKGRLHREAEGSNKSPHLKLAHDYLEKRTTLLSSFVAKFCPVKFKQNYWWQLPGSVFKMERHVLSHPHFCPSFLLVKIWREQPFWNMKWPWDRSPLRDRATRWKEPKSLTVSRVILGLAWPPRLPGERNKTILSCWSHW